MKKTALYQAIDGGRKAVPQTPIYCSTSNARLGHGYYFWDSIIDAAHWWGGVHYGGNYIICQSFYDAHSDKLFDLLGDLSHRQEFTVFLDGLHKMQPEDMSLAEVLDIMNANPKFSQRYWAIRAEFIKMGPSDKNLDITVSLPSQANGRKTVLHCGNRVQLCVTNLAFLLEGEYTAIYPEYRDASYMA